MTFNSKLKKKLVLFLFVLVPFLSKAQEQKGTIVYVFDPICGWCYTFSPVIEKLHAKFKDKIDFTIVSGGMITGTRIRPIADLSEFILSGYEDMQNLTNVKFGEAYIQMVTVGKELLDSERPACAMSAFKALHPEQSLDFAHKLQEAHFKHGKSYNNDSTYVQLANAFKIEPGKFIALMNSEKIKEETRNDFKKVEEAGINGFPTLLIKLKGQVLPLTHGFEKYEKLEKKIEKLLN